jgi:hypothetical protein
MTPKIRIVLLTALLTLASAGAAAASQQCRDEKGKFIKCPPAAAEPATRCRDIKTKKFAKCGAPDTEPVPAKAK